MRSKRARSPAGVVHAESLQRNAVAMSGPQVVSESHTIRLALSVVGAILISISGYLGGELVFKHGVAVNPQDDRRVEAREKARDV
ncbi:MAG TPA: hypothetical protein VGB17_11350 [Pyrinomonadaceae bacterium]|jgi:hypothetical protein